jgi:26S proteasome regulatory subunit N5
MDYSLEPDLADLDPEVINKRTKEDFSEAADKHIKSAEELAKNGYLEKALQLLHSLEKQTRTAADVASAERVLISIVSLCFEANKLPLLQENIVLLCKRRGQLNSAITKMISKCCEFVDSITNLEDKLNYIKTLREVTDGKIYVELFRARLTMSLAIIREEMGEVTEAADILQELQVETFGSMQRKEKVEFMLQQVRLCLAKEDFIRAQIISNKIPCKTLESDDFQNEKLRFHKLMIQLDEHEKNYLSICRHYLAMYNTKIVKEDDDLLKENLKHILAYLILAPYDNEQWDLLNRIYNDVNCDKIPTYKELLKCFITKEILDWSAFGKAFISEFEKSGCYSSDFDGKMKALSQRVSEHNTRVIAGYYNRISVNRMSELLGLSNQETETIVSDLVVQKKIFAKIDRPAGIITFSRVKDPNEILNDWTNNINQLMSLVENNTHLINLARNDAAIMKVRT